MRYKTSRTESESRNQFDNRVKNNAKLLFNKKKMRVMVCSRSTSWMELLSFSLKKSLFRWTQEVVINRALNWRKHVKPVQKKVGKVACKKTFCKQQVGIQTKSRFNHLQKSCRTHGLLLCRNLRSTSNKKWAKKF